MKETDLVRQCLQTLMLYGVFAWRNNTGAHVTGEGPSRRYIRFGVKGSPDIIGILPGRGQFLGVECKVGKGRQTMHQEEFQASVEERGGRYWLVRDVTELIELLQAWRKGD